MVLFSHDLLNTGGYFPALEFMIIVVLFMALAVMWPRPVFANNNAPTILYPIDIISESQPNASFQNNQEHASQYNHIYYYYNGSLCAYKESASTDISWASLAWTSNCTSENAAQSLIYGRTYTVKGMTGNDIEGYSNLAEQVFTYSSPTPTNSPSPTLSPSPTASPSPTPNPYDGSTITINFATQSAEAMAKLTYAVWMGFAMTIIGLGILGAFSYYRRR